MILCFTGTGNSRRVANQLQDILGDKIIRLAPGQMVRPEGVTLKVNDDRVILVTPVHSWGLPSLVAKVMRRSKFTGKGCFKHYLVLTCGDDIGQADHQWRKLVRARGFEPISAYSVQMPNTYTFLPGFDVDPAPLAEQKLRAAVPAVDKIAKSIADGEHTTQVARGSYPWIKSKILYPIFQRFMCSTKPFHATDACTGCGKCARNCSTGNITIINGRPVWGKTCNTCMRCYHCCPRHAVAYGNRTAKKGQYLCPGYLLN